MIDRRTLLLSAAASAVTPSAAKMAPPQLTAKEALIQLAPEGYDAATLWCFDGQSPGPEIRVRQGRAVQRRFVNELAQPSTIHWHGIRLQNAMDGVPGLTQPAVAPGEFFEYDFVPPDAGTYWYHSHNRSWEQMARGLYGPLIVDESEAPEIDQDITLVFDDWRLAESGGLAGGYGNLQDNSHAGRLGNIITVNGRISESIRTNAGERLRLRLINTANARIFELGWRNLSAWIVALDGMPLAAPQQTGLVTLAPAQRADLIVDVLVTDEAPLIYMIEDGTGYVLVEIVMDKGGTRTTRSAPLPLPPNPLPELHSEAEAETTTLLMEGGAMGRLSSAVFEGEELSLREMVDHGMVWTMNGIAGLAEDPLFTVDRGTFQRLRFINETVFPHGMHLHGHHFREVLSDGSLGPWRDTILVEQNEAREVAMVADNPGKWLLHCHMLGHQAAGMKTWIEVKA